MKKSAPNWQNRQNKNRIVPCVRILFALGAAAIAVAALVFAGCDDSGINKGESAVVDKFYSRFSDINGSGGGDTVIYVHGFELTIKIEPFGVGEVMYQTKGSQVLLTAVPNDAGVYEFNEWTTRSSSNQGVSDKNSSSAWIRVDADVVITAGFASVGSVAKDTFTDDRDGKQYRTVEIGSLLWMAENLNYDDTDNSWCYDDSSSNCEKYGRLYTWEAAKSACPEGWRLSKNTDWNDLVKIAGGDNAEAGQKLKSKGGWRSSDGTDYLGFGALPGGYRDDSGDYRDVESSSHWWSADETNSAHTGVAWEMFDSFSTSSSVSSTSRLKTEAYSVRCVKSEAQ